jgi:outer membrane protein assembly factor BamB
MFRVKLPRRLAVGLLIPTFALLAAACGGIVSPQGWASPDVDNSTVYYFQKRNKLAAITLPSGNGSASVKWTFPDKTKPDEKDISLKATYGNPVLDNGTLYFADYSGKLFAVDASDGSLAQKPKEDISGSITGGPAISGNTLAFGTTDGHLYVLDKDTFSAATGWPAGGKTFSGAIWAPPVISNGVIYVATMDGEVYALNLKDGSQIWKQPFKVSGAIADLSLIQASNNGQTTSYLFVPSLNRHVYIVKLDGTAVNPDGMAASDWVWTEPAVKDGIAYFGDFSGKVYALNITSGQPVWKAPYDAKSKVKASPTIVDNLLVVATREPRVHFLNLSDGSLKAKFPIAGAGTVRAGITPYDSTPLVLTTSGKLFKADPKTGIVSQVVIGTQGS